MEKKTLSMSWMPSKARSVSTNLYTEGGDTLYVMDQISDKKKNREKLD